MAKVLVLLLLGCLGLWMMHGDNSPPRVEDNQWWGNDELRSKQDTSIRPFEINFDEHMIRDLKQRLKNHREWTPPLVGAAFRYGFNSAGLNEWLQYWSESYNFSKRQDFLNQFPHYKTNIQGLDIHFIRVKPNVPSNISVVPLLLIHGWPGSVREFYEAIPHLAQLTPGYDFAFEVIVVSLPGFGFSEGTSKQGLSVPKISVVLRNLMHRLGFKQFYIQGGDWGAFMASSMAVLFPGEVLGMHSNLGLVVNTCSVAKTILGSFIPSLFVDSHLHDRVRSLPGLLSFLMNESGYFHLQATKPDTIGFGLNDSPAGLLTYILEKFSLGTKLANQDHATGNLEDKFSKDQLLDHLMFYWATNAITTSMRLYAESSTWKALGIEAFKTDVPAWFLQAKYEIFYQPPSILNCKFSNIINTTVLDYGGHFIALEEPQTFAADLFKAVAAFREYHQKNVKIEL